MRKLWLIIIAIVAFIVLAVLGYFAFRGQPVPTNNSNGDNVVSLDVNNLPKDSRIAIPTKSGGPIEMNNFILQAQQVNPSRVDIVAEADSGIAYSLPDSTFYITISAENNEEFYKIRNEIETKLLDSLSIGQAEACQLRVEERTMPMPDGTLGNLTFPLSFCNN